MCRPQVLLGFFNASETMLAIGIPALPRFLMGLGRYGVDIFFLMSGYAMAKNAVAKNATEKKPGRAFWEKRLRGTYVPYLILAGIIEICAGGAVTPGKRISGSANADAWSRKIRFTARIIGAEERKLLSSVYLRPPAASRSRTARR